MFDVQIHDGVAVLTMNDGKANAIGDAWLERMNAALDGLDANARALVVTGFDRTFCAGLALPTLIDRPREQIEAFITRFSDTMLRLFTLEIPVVAAVNGHAIAGGCVLALQCDYRVMARGTGQIGLNEVRLGIGLPAVVSETLRVQVPSRSLFPIALEGKLVHPDEALALGLVNELALRDDVLPRAARKARELAALPRAAFAQIKRGVRAPAVERVRAAKGDAAAWTDTWFAPEAQTILRALVARLGEKKKPG